MRPMNEEERKAYVAENTERVKILTPRDRILRRERLALPPEERPPLIPKRDYVQWEQNRAIYQAPDHIYLQRHPPPEVEDEP